jgi:hypothetical protein
MADLTASEKRAIETLLRMEGGYVLDFSDRTFRDFVVDSSGLDIYDEEHSSGGTSKAKRLRTFWRLHPNGVVGRLLADLFEYGQVTDSLAADLKLLWSWTSVERWPAFKATILSLMPMRYDRSQMTMTSTRLRTTCERR